MVRNTSLLPLLVTGLLAGQAIPAQATSFPMCTVEITDNCTNENGQYIPPRVGDPAPVGDYEAPSVPQAVRVNGDVETPEEDLCQAKAYVIRWDASTDNVAVAGYRVNEITPGVYDRYQVTQQPEARITLRAGTHMIAVQAFDAAGNLSGYSQTYTVVVPQPTTPVTTVPPVIPVPVDPVPVPNGPDQPAAPTPESPQQPQTPTDPKELRGYQMPTPVAWRASGRDLVIRMRCDISSAAPIRQNPEEEWPDCTDVSVLACKKVQRTTSYQDGYDNGERLRVVIKGAGRSRYVHCGGRTAQRSAPHRSHDSS
jgi:hypothetical protein